MNLIRLILLSLFIFTQSQADTIYNLIKIPNLEIDDFVSYLWAFLKFKAAMYAIDVKTISDIRDDKPSGAPW